MALLALAFLLGASAPPARAAAADVEWAAAAESAGELSPCAAGLRDALAYLGDGEAPPHLPASVFLAAERPGFGDLPSRLSVDPEVKRRLGALVRRIHREISSGRAFAKRSARGDGLNKHAPRGLAARVVLLHRLPALLNFADDPEKARRQIEAAYETLRTRSPDLLRRGEEVFWLAESRERADRVVAESLKPEPALPREPFIHLEGRTYPLGTLSRHLKDAAPGEHREIRRVLEGSGFRLDLSAGRTRLFFEEPRHVEELKDLILDGLLAPFMEHLGVDQLIVHHFDDRHLLRIMYLRGGRGLAGARFSLRDFTTGDSEHAGAAEFQASDAAEGRARIVAGIDGPWAREHALSKLERLEGPKIGGILRDVPPVFALAFLTAQNFRLDARAGDRGYFTQTDPIASALSTLSPERLALAKRNMSLHGLEGGGGGQIRELENWGAGRLDEKWLKLLGALRVAAALGADWGLVPGHELADMIEAADVLEQGFYTYDEHGVWRAPMTAAGEAGAIGR